MWLEPCNSSIASILKRLHGPLGLMGAGTFLSLCLCRSALSLSLAVLQPGSHPSHPLCLVHRKTALEFVFPLKHPSSGVLLAQTETAFLGSPSEVPVIPFCSHSHWPAFFVSISLLICFFFPFCWVQTCKQKSSYCSLSYPELPDLTWALTNKYPTHFIFKWEYTWY